MPSPILGHVVWWEDIDVLPNLSEKMAVIYSDREIRYRTSEERHLLSSVVIEHLATIRGGHCFQDRTMATCMKSPYEPLTGPKDLHFHHRCGTSKLYHIRDYQHCITSKARQRNLDIYLNEALKCDPVCWRHHISYHQLRRRS
jgi:hypothetical protein